MAFKFKRIFLIVADSVGIGGEPDAEKYGDAGSNTLVHISEGVGGLNIPTLNSFGIGDLAPIVGTTKVAHPHSYATTSREESNGKDTMTGHWEMMGIYTEKPFQTFTDTGFPPELIKELEEKTGHKIIGNYSASGTEILKELGEQQMRENSLIVYTSADSVLQIAAHEEVTGVQELYRCCDIAREICMKPEWMVGRIIARPFIGTDASNFKRTPNRHDLALRPSNPTVMNILQDNGFMTSCVGKIADIYDQYGVTKTQKTISNEDGMDKTIAEAKNHDFTGLCFVNLVEFDSEYGHRRDVPGYAGALERFDKRLKELTEVLREDDLLIVTADHGNDPTWHGTDHTRERVPLLLFSKSFKNGRQIEERGSFADMGATILKNFKLEKPNNLIGTPIKDIFVD
ncbi:MAG: phosphopentomutase [Erysipelotrichaceae bacterium]|jgi:phosphopentomutase|nr:phosphopentomutase [Bacilli bacterium]NLV28758.1 phosphopentomutase [Erysipelotrichaceae bacterium]HPY79453.1 phosphopentomutase [Bacilli bacterium]HQA55521.1 phosphopentomutase [Bacilli bacterium]